MGASLSIPSSLTKSPLDIASVAGANAQAKKLAAAPKDKAWAAAQDFESVFLNNMFQHMFTSTEGEGPLGSKGAGGVWRSFLTDEYAKSFTKAGGIGIAKQVYATLLQQQETAAR